LTSTLTPTQDLARRVDQATADAGPGRSLRRDSLRFLRTAALPVGIQGPTAGVIIGPFGWVVLAAAASAAAGAAILLIPGLLARMRRSRLLAVTATAAHLRTR